MVPRHRSNMWVCVVYGGWVILYRQAMHYLAEIIDQKKNPPSNSSQVHVHDGGRLQQRILVCEEYIIDTRALISSCATGNSCIGPSRKRLLLVAAACTPHTLTTGMMSRGSALYVYAGMAESQVPPANSFDE